MSRLMVSMARRGLRAGGALGACFLAMSGTVGHAQGYSREVVQALPNPATARLNEALLALSRDPSSLAALLNAGQASLALDSVDAALGFFRRAEAIAPRDGQVKAGLAAVLVRQQQPVAALNLFAEAESAGVPMAPHAADRGLAYDLVGDNARAQEQYRLALSQGEDVVVTRRLAVSQAIAGDQRASEATLLPLLQRSDLASYRTRAFALAILGKADEAVSIAETMLPERISSRMSPYLRFMPRLTRAQQAAAANLGAFPQAADIGRDGPALAAYAAGGTPAQVPAVEADAGARLVPSGEPLGRREGVIPRREDVAASAVLPVPPPAQAAPAEVALVQPVQAVPAPVAEQAPAPAPAPTPAFAEVPGPTFSLAAVSAPEPEPALPSPPVEIVSLSDVFADFSRPRTAVGPQPGAVDITAIVPPRELPKPVAEARPAPPPPPAHPSRQWVQVATGRDEAALAFDWRRIKRTAGGLLDTPAPHIAAWGQTNRLVAGPFASAKEAQDMVAKLKEKNIDSFRFTSSRGEEVKALD